MIRIGLALLIGMALALLAVAASGEPGVLVVTRRNQAPIVLFGAEFTRARKLRSWDRFYVPLPFSRVKMHSRVLPPINPDGTKLDADQVRAALMEVNPDLPD